MSLIDSPAIPKGSLVVVTGATGFIGSHISDQFLQRGYKVRATTRDVSKNAWVSELFAEKYGADKFSLVAVPDMAAPGAFDDVVKGAAAVVHTATDTSLSPNPNAIIPWTVEMVLSAIRSAAKEPLVKRFVLTSSSVTASANLADTPGTLTVDSWNDGVIEVANRPPPYEPERAWSVYAAAKTLAEKEAWKFVQQEKPAFVLNTVLPNLALGKSLSVEHQGHPSTAGMLAALFKGDATYMKMLPPQHFVDVQDAARLHVAAAIHPDVVSERIFGFAAPYNGDLILDIFRKMHPNKTFPENFQSGRDLYEVVPRARAEQLLRDLGQGGWTTLEQSLKWNTEDLE
ncbi:aldehyde reductase [Microdochium trichocladiopsis]|uniref:Aldehyde reductase n=1 Tax=Microdochium trichocladiopsis TaxID=1682393 RepID=A0A9P8Y7L8_9PEZI|nr:aldehyde reductase [Microdochium trichocladiopsis]KAH7032612.1 aldehyde reductase [Microdochium trichocladiopsis]